MKEKRSPISSVVVAGLAIALLPAVASATERGVPPIVVDTTLDNAGAPDGLCSLREAIHAANTNAPVDGCSTGSPGPNLIQVPAGTYELALVGPDEDANATGDLDILESVIIQGLAPEFARGPVSTATVVGDGSDRVFHVHPGTNVFLENLVVSGGDLGGLPLRAERGALSGFGGGLLNEGMLNLTDVSFVDNTVTGASADISRGGGGGSAEPARGGAIYSTGSLNMLRTSFTSNSARGGAGSFDFPGGEASGGAVEVLGNFQIRESSFVENAALGGGRGFGLEPGGPAYGGALALGNGGTIADSTFDTNVALGAFPSMGVRGAALDVAIAPSGGSDSPDARGGAIFHGASAPVQIQRSTFSGNTAEGGVGALGGGEGGGGAGGAIFHASGILSVESCTFAGNGALGGEGGLTGDFGGGVGGNAAGGAIFTTRPGPIPARVAQCTLSGNVAVGGDGGDGVDLRGGGAVGGAGGNARGGHLAEPLIPVRGDFASFLVGNSILAGGTAVAGAGGPGVPPGLPGSASGPGCDAQIETDRGNVESTTDSCGLSGGAGDLVAVSEGDLDLGALTDNGGPTATQAPGGSSVALDLAIVGVCPELDQRGFTRIDGTCDSGSLDTGAVDLIFRDGFESEDDSAWDDSVGF